jgi:hypothetical protein
MYTCRQIFWNYNISKLSIVPFDKGSCTDALDVLLGFEDSKISTIEKKDEI